ncbi:MAG: spondin domain-containing protein [Pseudomonadota bacterium]
MRILTKSAVALAALMVMAPIASATTIQITITNNAPAGAVFLTPVWVGLHDGSFDSYDNGAPASAGIEAIAEDGNTVPLSNEFNAPGGVQGVVGGAPIAPGQTVTLTLDVASDGSNNYLSYASMVLPSNDYFVANGNPLAHSIESVLNGSATELSFNIGMPGTVNDAGTEINDFLTSAGNGLFGFPGGQSGPNQGADENGVITNVLGQDPFGNFLNLPPGFDASLFNFNDDFWSSGIATITVTAVPVPAALPLFAGALGMLGFMRRRATR